MSSRICQSVVPCLSEKVSTRRTFLNDNCSAAALKKYHIFFALLVSLASALALRCSVANGRTFPMEDGGLWYVVADAVINNGLMHPREIEFNGKFIPYCYPPLAGLLIADVVRWGGHSVLEVLTHLPWILNVLSVIPFALFAVSFFKNSFVAVLAILIYPFPAAGYDAFLWGGGVPRSLGLILQLVTWWFLFREWSNNTLKGVAIGVAGALTCLTHPSAALWTVCGIFLWCVIERRISARVALIAFATCGLSIIPWLIVTTSHAGILPFINAFSVGGVEVFGWKYFGQPDSFLLQGFLGSLALIGIFIFLRDGKFAIPALMYLGFAIDHRGLMTLSGFIIGVLASAHGTASLLDLIKPTEGKTARQAFVKCVFLLLLGLHLVLPSIEFVRGHERFASPSSDEVSAFRELGNVLPRREKVLYIRGQIHKSDSGEWFSTLSKLRIAPLAHVEEWSGSFGNNMRLLIELEKCCASGSWECVEEALNKTEPLGSVIAVHSRSCPLLALTPPPNSITSKFSQIVNIPYERNKPNL